MPGFNTKFYIGLLSRDLPKILGVELQLTTLSAIIQIALPENERLHRKNNDKRVIFLGGGF